MTPIKQKEYIDSIYVMYVTTGIRRRGDEQYHPQLERSEFYTMANRTKQVILFNPIDTTGNLSTLQEPPYIPVEELHTKVLV